MPSLPNTKVKKKIVAPWWNDECANTKKTHQRAYNTLRCTSLPTEWGEYKQYSAVVKRLTMQAKRAYWRSIAHQ